MGGFIRRLRGWESACRPNKVCALGPIGMSLLGLFAHLGKRGEEGTLMYSVPMMSAHSASTKCCRPRVCIYVFTMLGDLTLSTPDGQRGPSSSKMGW